MPSFPGYTASAFDVGYKTMKAVEITFRQYGIMVSEITDFRTFPVKVSLKNWQGKRFMVDISYILVYSGQKPLRGIDRKIPPTKRVRQTVKDLGIENLSHLLFQNKNTKIKTIDYEKVKEACGEREIEVVEKIEEAEEKIKSLVSDLDSKIKAAAKSRSRKTVSRLTSEKISANARLKNIQRTFKEEFIIYKDYDDEFPKLFKDIKKITGDLKSPEENSKKSVPTYKEKVESASRGILGEEFVEKVYKFKKVISQCHEFKKYNQMTSSYRYHAGEKLKSEIAEKKKFMSKSKVRDNKYKEVYHDFLTLTNRYSALSKLNSDEKKLFIEIVEEKEEMEKEVGPLMNAITANLKVKRKCKKKMKSLNKLMSIEGAEKSVFYPRAEKKAKVNPKTTQLAKKIDRKKSVRGRARGNFYKELLGGDSKLIIKHLNKKFEFCPKDFIIRPENGKGYFRISTLKRNLLSLAWRDEEKGEEEKGAKHFIEEFEANWNRVVNETSWRVLEEES